MFLLNRYIERVKKSNIDNPLLFFKDIFIEITGLFGTKISFTIGLVLYYIIRVNFILLLK